MQASYLLKHQKKNIVERILTFFPKESSTVRVAAVVVKIFSLHYLEPKFRTVVPGGGVGWFHGGAAEPGELARGSLFRFVCYRRLFLSAFAWMREWLAMCGVVCC